MELKEQLLQSVDIVVIITDHSCYDYQLIVDNAKIIFDTRNATKGVKEKVEKIYKL